MVNFSKDWNGKLSWGLIPTVRYHDWKKYFYYQRIMHNRIKQKIMLNNKEQAEGYLWIMKNMLLKNIPDFIKRADTGLSPKEFDKLMFKMYSRKLDWKGVESRMIVLIFVKDFTHNNL